jgi:hypothetical protein
MSLSATTKNALSIAVANEPAANELITVLNAAAGAELTKQTHPNNVAVTFTANAPATYASPTGSFTVADGSSATATELLRYCDELRGVLTSLISKLEASGLLT